MNIIYNDEKHLKKILKEFTKSDIESLLNGKCVIKKMNDTQQEEL